MSIEITTKITVTIKDKKLFKAFGKKFRVPSMRHDPSFEFYPDNFEEWAFVRDFTQYDSSNGLSGNTDWEYKIIP